MDINTVSDHEGDEKDAPFAPVASAMARPRRLDVRELEERIRHYNSDLKSCDPTFRAAVILLAGLEYGHNIDVIARRTAYDRAFVSRVARRLIDNGVWRVGVTVADWSSADEASGTFWNDVAVAEGKMCRRIAPDGRVEWAPAGFWNKNFGFIDPGADQRLATLYLDPLKPAPAAEVAEDVGPSPETAGTEAVPGAAPSPAAGEAAGPAADSTGSGDQPPPAAARPEGPVPSLEDHFGPIVWLR